MRTPTVRAVSDAMISARGVRKSFGKLEECACERRVARSARNAVPVHLLPHGTRDLEHRAKVRVLLADREKLGDEHVVDGRDERALRAHLELGGTREMLVSDGSAGRVKDEIDEVVVLPRLVQPVLACGRRPLRVAPRPRASSLPRASGSSPEEQTT